jgi:hypothetical protein
MGSNTSLSAATVQSHAGLVAAAMVSVLVVNASWRMVSSGSSAGGTTAIVKDMSSREYRLVTLEVPFQYLCFPCCRGRVERGGLTSTVRCNQCVREVPGRLLFLRPVVRLDIRGIWGCHVLRCTALRTADRHHELTKTRD